MMGTEVLENDSARNTEYRDLLIAQIQPSKYNPRKNFDPKSLEELTASIREQGLLEPIVVRPLDITIGESFSYDGHRFTVISIYNTGLVEINSEYVAGIKISAAELQEQSGRKPVMSDEERHYEIIAGERRWWASQRAKIDTIPARILHGIDDNKARELALLENLVRSDLNPIEEANGYKSLIDLGYTQEQIADKTGKKQGTIGNMLRLLKLPNTTKELVQKGELTMSHARALVPFAEHTEVLEALAEAAVNGANTKDLERFDLQKLLTYEKINSLPIKNLTDWRTNFDRATCSSCREQRHNICLDIECYERKNEEARKKMEADRASRNNTPFHETVTIGSLVAHKGKWEDRGAAKVVAKSDVAIMIEWIDRPRLWVVFKDFDSQWRFSGAGENACYNAAKHISEVKAHASKVESEDSAPDTGLSDDQKKALIRAVHNYSDAESRWNKRVKTGLSDAGIRDAISEELGIEGGISGPDMISVSFKGGANPRIWFGILPNGQPDLSGKALVDAVRDLLNIPQQPKVSEPATAPETTSKSENKFDKCIDWVRHSAPSIGHICNIVTYQVLAGCNVDAIERAAQSVGLNIDSTPWGISALEKVEERSKAIWNVISSLPYSHQAMLAAASSIEWHSAFDTIILDLMIRANDPDHVPDKCFECDLEDESMCPGQEHCQILEAST